jgi:hypothetical protein
MKWIVNRDDENFQIILFNMDERNWEIIIDKGLYREEIDALVLRRITELILEKEGNNGWDYSDLIVDYKKEVDN